MEVECPYTHLSRNRTTVGLKDPNTCDNTAAAFVAIAPQWDLYLADKIFSARCKTAPYIEPNFPCRAGFYTLPTKNFFRRGVKPHPTLSRFSSRSGRSPTLRNFSESTTLACRFSLVMQGFTPCRQIFFFFSARYKTAPYIEPIFISVGQEPNPPKFLGEHDSGVPNSFGQARARPSDMLNFRLSSSPTLRILLFGSAGAEPPEG